jgi:hypothetical protein
MAGTVLIFIKKRSVMGVQGAGRVVFLVLMLQQTGDSLYLGYTAKAIIQMVLVFDLEEGEEEEDT